MNRSSKELLNRSPAHRYRKGERRNDRGASMLEYAIIGGILVAVFVVVGQRLLDATLARGNASTNSVANTVPCGNGGRLSGDQCL